MPTKTDLIQSASIEKKIMLLRGQKVMLDSDLATLYEVTTFNPNFALRKRKRNNFTVTISYSSNSNCDAFETRQTKK